MAHYSSSSSDLPVQGPQPSDPSVSATSAAASSRASVAWQSGHILASDHGALDDNLSFSLTLYEDPWKIKKVLTTSDMDGSCRLLLSTKATDESCGNNLCLKKLYNTDSFVLTGKWRSNFVNRKSLKEGDMIGLAWDGAQFCFTLLNRN